MSRIQKANRNHPDKQSRMDGTYGLSKDLKKTLKDKMVLLLFSVMLLSSCASKKDIYYMQAQDGISGNIDFVAPKIQVNDIISIIITADNLEAAQIFNTTSVSAAGGIINVEMLKLTGYLVDEKGQIDIPTLGTILVTDKTISELEVFVAEKIKEKKYLDNPTVSARVLNAKVTISGEVARPGTYTFTEQVLTLPQALGYAGDLTINGKRNNILLIREENGERTYTNIDLTKSDFFNSPYYYIKQNDWIYVYPNAPKVASSGFIGNVGTVLGLGSFILTITILLTR